MKNITLTHNQVIRVKGFRRSTSRIRVRTSSGMAAEHGSQPHDNATPWVIQDTAVLDGRDKSANYVEIDAAPEIENGQQVIIEGKCYAVKVNGQQYSDPVEFVSAEAHPGQGLVLGADGIARPSPAPDWAVLGPKLAEAVQKFWKLREQQLLALGYSSVAEYEALCVEGDEHLALRDTLALLPAA